MTKSPEHRNVYQFHKVFSSYRIFTDHSISEACFVFKLNVFFDVLILSICFLMLTVNVSRVDLTDVSAWTYFVHSITSITTSCTVRNIKWSRVEVTMYKPKINHWCRCVETYLCSLSENWFPGSKYTKNILFNYENRSNGNNVSAKNKWPVRMRWKGNSGAVQYEWFWMQIIFLVWILWSYTYYFGW